MTAAGAMGTNERVSAIAAGESHSLGLKDGKIFAWGANGYGQLGLDTSGQPVTTPKVNLLANAVTPEITMLDYEPDHTTTFVQNAEGPTLTVTASVYDDGELSYQWYVSDKNSNTDGTSIPDATEMSYTVPTDQLGTFYYYVEVMNTKDEVVFNKTASVKSVPVEVRIVERVDAAVPVIVKQPEGATVTQGAASPTLTVTASIYGNGDGELTYQWYVNDEEKNSDGEQIAGAKSASYKPPTDQVGTKYYYVVVTNINDAATGNKTASIASKAVAVTVTRPSGGSSGGAGNVIDPRFGRDIDYPGIHLSFPVGVWHEIFTITINKLQNLQASWQPREGKAVSDVYDITKDRQGELLEEYTITLSFSLKDEEKDQYEPAVYRWDEETKEWVPLKDLTVHWNERKVSGKTKETGKFAVIAKEKQTAEPSLAQLSRQDIAGHWAEKHIRALAEKGWISGYPDNTFRPDQTITRAEFVCIVVYVLGLELSGEKTFVDTADHWAEDIIAAAYAHGIIRGYNDTTFGPDDPITREQMAENLVNAFGLQLKQGGEGKTFTDQEQISAWAREAIEIAASHGLFVGYEDGTFRPRKQTTRAEAAAVLARAFLKME